MKNLIVIEKREELINGVVKNTYYRVEKYVHLLGEKELHFDSSAIFSAPQMKALQLAIKDLEI